MLKHNWPVMVAVIISAMFLAACYTIAPCTTGKMHVQSLAAPGITTVTSTHFTH